MTDNDKALAVRNGGERQVATLGIQDQLGMSGDFDSSDVVLPKCAIVQPTSGSERGQAGTFYFNDGRSEAEIDTVVLDIVATRAMWAPMDTEPSGIICRSGDRREGITNYPSIVLSDAAAKKQNMKDGEPAYIPCDLCPHSKDDPFSDSDYLCKTGFTLLMVDQATEIPFLMFIKGTAMNVVKQVIVSPQFFRYRRGLALEPWRHPLHWSLRLREEKRGKWYVPEIKRLPPLTDEEADSYAMLASQQSGRAQTVMEEEALERGEMVEGEAQQAPAPLG